MDVCGTCGRERLVEGVDEVEAAIRTLRMRAEDGEPRAAAYVREAPFALRLLIQAAELVNRRQHAGCTVEPVDWSNLYDATNDARAVLVKVRAAGWEG